MDGINGMIELHNLVVLRLGCGGVDQIKYKFIGPSNTHPLWRPVFFVS